MKKILTLVLMLGLMSGGLSWASQAPQARYYDDDYNDRYESDYDYDDYLEEKYEREAYLRAQAQYQNRAQQGTTRSQTRPAIAPVAPVNPVEPVNPVAPVQDVTETSTNSGDTLSQIAATVDLFDTCEINGVPVSCQELLNRGNQLITQTPLLKGLFGNINGLVRFALSVMIIGGLISLLTFIFTLWMLIDLVSKQKDNKVVWLLVILFFPLVGAILYYFLAKRKRTALNEEHFVEETPKSTENNKKSDSDIVDLDE